jgi:steroid delta-isomerase-like uncharacterized protein
MAQERSSSTAGTPESSTQTPTPRADIVALFERRQAAFDNLDAAALAADYADDCVVESPIGGTHTGRAAVQKVFQTVFDAFLDQKLRTEALVVDGSRAAHVTSIEGTNLGGFLGLPASNKPFRLTAVFVCEFRDGKIVREQRVYDFTRLLMQIGTLKVKLP